MAVRDPVGFKVDRAHDCDISHIQHLARDGHLTVNIRIEPHHQILRLN